VALYVDGVYIGGQAGSVLSLNNIQMVEVDKGPQGTLFGRNATGGLIQVTTRDPRQEFGWSGSAGYGNYDSYHGDIYLTGGLTPNLAADLSVSLSRQDDGYGTNLYNGRDVNKTQDFSLRSKITWNIGDRTDVRLAGDFERTKSSPVLVIAPGSVALGGYTYDGPKLGANSYYQPYSLSRRGGASLKIDHDMDFARLISISAWRRSKTHLEYDSLVPDPFLGLNLDKTDSNEQFSEELQLQSASGSTIHWNMGVFLYQFTARYDPINVLSEGLFLPFEGVRYFSSQRTRSAAIYGQATAPITSKTNVTIGLRYTTERRTVWTDQNLLAAGGSLISIGVDDARRTFSKLTWRASVDHHFSNAVMIYGSYNRGFKSGGFNEITLPLSPYAPETLDAWEAGVKAQTFDRAVTFNASGFYYDYKNIQTVRYLNQSARVYNGSGAKLYGVDIDATLRPTQRLTLNVGAEFMHATYGSFVGADRTAALPGGGTVYLTTNDDGSIYNAKGNRVALAPNTMLNASADYQFPLGAGELKMHADYAWMGSWYAEPDNRLRQKSYGLLNGQLAFTPAGTAWTVRLWAKNLTNERYLITLGSQDIGDFAAYGAPRTYGFSIEKSF
jgi:iron complex outermembrane receptor protein